MGVLGAIAIIAASLILKFLASNGVIDSESSKRAMQVIIGVMLLVVGNLIPKTLEPLRTACGGPSKEQSLKRFAGWTFVIAGIAYAIIWMVAPLDYASLISMSVVIAAILMVAIPLTRSVIRCRSAQESKGL